MLVFRGVAPCYFMIHHSTLLWHPAILNCFWCPPWGGDWISQAARCMQGRPWATLKTLPGDVGNTVCSPWGVIKWDPFCGDQTSAANLWYFWWISKFPEKTNKCMNFVVGSGWCHSSWTLLCLGVSGISLSPLWTILSFFCGIFLAVTL